MYFSLVSKTHLNVFRKSSDSLNTLQRGHRAALGVTDLLTHFQAHLFPVLQPSCCPESTPEVRRRFDIDLAVHQLHLVSVCLIGISEIL